MATNQKKVSGVTPSKNEQVKHEKHVAAGKKGGETVKKEAGKK